MHRNSLILSVVLKIRITQKNKLSQEHGTDYEQ